MFLLSKSEVFQGYNLKSKVTDIALEQIKFIESTQLGLNYIILKNSKLNREELVPILEMYEKGVIKLFYDPMYPNIAPFIPYESPKVRGMYNVAINIAHHINKDGVSEESKAGTNFISYDIEPNKLKNLLFAGAACLASASSDGFRHIAVARDSQIQLMANMWIKALSRVSTFATNAENAGHFRYVFGKWIMTHIFGNNDSDTVKGVAYKIAAVRNYERSRAFDIKFEDSELMGYETADFVEKVLRTEFPQLHKLDLTAVKMGFVNMGVINTICIDYIPYVAALTASHPFEFLIYNNRNIKEELKDDIKNANIAISMAFQKRLEYLNAQ